ncbi:hypothetical protein KIS4809_2090 [Bacillus sp. ZZV12-4809]|nr:hypothetical protein KIS4809_2090 [Bacillus sp. ZZV12-4809]
MAGAETEVVAGSDRESVKSRCRSEVGSGSDRTSEKKAALSPNISQLLLIEKNLK